MYFNELIGPMFGWIDTKVYDQTKDEQKAVGWCGQVLDTNGDGKITRPWNVVADAAATRRSIRATRRPAAARGRARRSGAPSIPKLDTMVSYSLYAVIPSPVDDSVWGVSEQYPRLPRPPAARQQPAGVLQGADLQGARARLRSARRGHRQPRRRLDGARGQQPSRQLRRAQVQGPERAREDRRQPVPRRLDALSDDRSEAEGHGHPGGLPLLQLGGSAEHLGLRREYAVRDRIELRCAAGARIRRRREWTTLRVPYPLGFYSRGMDGRIDDANAGWKGRALYANYGTHFVWHIEGGKGTKGKVVKFQVRPDPLAR